MKRIAYLAFLIFGLQAISWAWDFGYVNVKSTATINSALVLPYVRFGNCLQTNSSGTVTDAGSPCGTGGGGGGTITGVTTGYGLIGGGTSGNVKLSLSGATTSYLQNTATLQTGTTGYPDFLYVGTSETVKGNFEATGTTKLGALSGILKATVGTVSGSATTTDLTEGSNLYFTTDRATSSISATSPLTYSAGVVGVDTSSVTLLGPLTFSSPLSRSGTVVSIPVASSGQNGYLTSTDWSTFNGKGTGSVTSVTAGYGLSGGAITTAGTISLLGNTTSYIQNTATAQSGAQFNLSSGVVGGLLSVNKLDILNSGTLYYKFPYFGSVIDIKGSDSDSVVPTRLIAASAESKGAMYLESGVSAPGGDYDTLAVSALGNGRAANITGKGPTVLLASAGDVSAVPLAAQGIIGQSADLQEWRSYTGVALASVTASGVFTGDGSGLTGLIKNQNTLQNGTTFYVSSGSVSGQLTAGSIKWPDGTIQVSSPTVGGIGTITGVTAGYGLTGGGTSGNVALNLNGTTTSYIQNTGTLQGGATLFVASGTVSGTLIAGTFSGSGASLTNIPTSAINNPSASFVMNQASLQNGATFYVSSGTVSGTFTATTLYGDGSHLTGISAGSAIYPATATVTFPYGMSVSTVAYSGSGLYRSIYLSAGAGLCQNANGCGPISQYQTATSSVNYIATSFSAGTTQYWQTHFTLPGNFTGSTILVQTVFSSTMAATTTWNIDAMAVQNGGNLDTAWGTAVIVSTASTAAGQIVQSQTSGAITPAGALTANNELFVRVYRGDATADALFLGLRIFYLTGQLAEH